MALRFDLVHCCGAARAAYLATPHGVVATPAFMPVGTYGAVKGMPPCLLEQTGTQIVLANTFHLALRPGAALIARLGGLHRFMAWPGPILTDSGGYQVFSLASLRQVSDHGVSFRSPVDGALLELTPEAAIAIQEQLGADLIMCLDECPAYGVPAHAIEQAVARTIQWARRSLASHTRADQALFGIVQGGLDRVLRRQCVTELVALGFPGYALGGFSVGEPLDQAWPLIEEVCRLLPPDRPRYLMGMGRPEDVLEAIHRGVDLFDCVLPTRNGRNAQAFTEAGVLRLRNACHKEDPRPLDDACSCYTCRHFSRAYVHHLFLTREMLGPILVSLHNIAFYQRLLAQARQAILADTWDAYRAVHLARFRSHT
ncbi:MAG: tRNA guanosine(34) transglycosylase Tgt [Gemmataceae bacterium]